METYRIESDLFLCIGDAYDSNSTVFLNGSEALLIDTLANRKDARELKNFVENKLQTVVRFIVCTHYFSDHIAGLKLFPESQILAHRNYLHTFDSELHRSEEEASHFAEPTILVSDNLTLRWGRFTLNLFYNPAHTMGELNIDIPEADLIHVGDTLVGNMVYFKYSSPAAFRIALEEIRRRGRKNLLSSHSNVRTIDSVDFASYYLNSLQQKSQEAWNNGSEQSISTIELND